MTIMQGKQSEEGQSAIIAAIFDEWLTQQTEDIQGQLMIWLRRLSGEKSRYSKSRNGPRGMGPTSAKELLIKVILCVGRERIQHG